MTEQKNNSGTIFPNGRKEKDTDADYTGSVLVDGKEYWVNGWKNTSKKGEPYLSVRMKLKQPKVTNPPAEEQYADAIPF